MTEISDRFGLPLLAVAQAQKEMTHNEALALIDLLISPVVSAIAPASIPATPQPGNCWIVGTSPIGAWAGQANKIAGWTLGGWRFIMPVDGMILWNLADSTSYQFGATGWAVSHLSGQQLSIGGNQVVGARQSAISSPTGGMTIDQEARSAVASILTALRTHGLIAA